ncbi:restriction endonuclease [Herbaspirillum huttiense]|uniref:Restriction endonuclease n=2 Tax=Herbaspirillum huttiense TaxID=863372 RepID=A0AAJ2H295_9BURK|nr:restriction endonuclease [Herbaspirillum huttiense]MDR9835239.1 restriction endonuclease [Herbaspirillum huttiense]
MNGEFSCHFLDERDRYLHVAIGLGQGAPRISSIDLIRQPTDGGEPLWNDDGEVSLQLIAAAVVRDFLVVEEREAVFSSRSLKKRVAGRNINTIIYLPRVRYSQPRIDHQVTPKDESSQRQRHAVTQHLRRVNGTSAAQRFLAQKYGISLPEGFTFVRPHVRGAEAHENRLKIYRSRSASHMIFERVASAPVGNRPAWFEFEKDCARILEHEGMKVIHQAAHRDGDGGMDLFAVDLEGNSWVVQCKCWAPHRPIGPDVIRDLVGAISQADRGATRTSRGMIITTTSLTSGAVSEAIASNFRIVDGVRFVKMMQDLAS